MAEPGRAELEDRALAWLIVERGLAEQAEVESLLASADRRRLLARIPGTNDLAALARERVRSCERCGRGVVVEAGPWTLRCSGCGASPGSASETVSVASPAAPDDVETASAAPGVVPGNAPAAPARGDRIAGYVVERELGRGAMGVVVLARRPGEPPVALKLMSRGTDELQQRFLREGRVLSRLRHPNIVSVREVGEASGVPWIAMEYVEGTPLSSLGKKGLALDDALAIAESIARALDHAHANGLVHRDLKPANVLVTNEGVPKVVDFGLAKDLMTASALTSEGSLLGTPHYMAPEAVRGAEKVTGAADVYALGTILYELATRTLPFESEARRGLKVMVKAIAEGGVEPPSRRRPDLGLSADFDALVLRALDRRLEVRYPSALAFAEDLARLRRGEPLAPPAPAESRPAPPRSGTRFGEFEALEVVGRGGSGIVHKGHGPRGETVAIKVLQDQSPGSRARFERERRILGLLGEAEGFVPLLATGETERGVYVVMPFVGGGTLRDRIARGMGVEDALAIVRAIARAMSHAHERGIVHRDLKPDNVLFTEKGVPLVADVGLAKHVADGPGVSRSVALTASGEFRGTAGYMPLEQMYDARSVTPASDVFALGAMAYECLAGDRPFKGSSVLEIVSNVEHERFEPLDRCRPDAPPWLVSVITRCLARDPERRFPDAGALARALEGPPARRRSPRRLVAATLVLGGLAGAIALGRPRRGTHADGGGGAPVASAQAVVSSSGVGTYVPLPYRSIVTTRRARLAGIWGSPDGKHGSEAFSVVAARDGKHVLSGSVDRTVKLWELVPASPGSKDVRIREVLSLGGHTSSVMSVALSGEPTPLHAISASLDGTLRVWDLARGVESATLADGTGEQNAVALSADGASAVAGGTDGVLRLWDLPGRSVIRRLDAHGGAIHAVALSADRTRALSGHADGRVRVWDLASDGGE
ncbi:MAG TPA: serine/threonine-protein kinase, partial [Planctomycetota bacterium]|nr:serine/threonine-protein kinase [Planctomycetota bacterium]